MHYIVSTGAAALQAYGLDTERTRISSNTPEDSYVYVNAVLSGNLLGPGDIYYRGSPVVSIQVDGVGEVVDDN